MQLEKLGAETVFKSGIAKDIFTPVAKIIIGFITSCELYYLLIDRFSMTPTVLKQMAQLTISFFAFVILTILLFIIGYVTCILGVKLLNFFALIAYKIFNESFYEKFLPIDPSIKGYHEEKDAGKTGYYRNMFTTIVDHLGLNYSSVGNEFFRLCAKIAVEKEDIFKPHVIAFDTTILRGLFVNSLLLVSIAINNGNLFFIIFSIVVLVVIYIENKNITDERMERVYDLAYLTIRKEKNQKETKELSKST